MQVRVPRCLCECEAGIRVGTPIPGYELALAWCCVTRTGGVALAWCCGTRMGGVALALVAWHSHWCCVTRTGGVALEAVWGLLRQMFDARCGL